LDKVSRSPSVALTSLKLIVGRFQSNLLCQEAILLFAVSQSLFLWRDTFDFKWLVACIVDERVETGRGGSFVGLEIVHDLEDVAQFLVVGDHVVGGAGLQHVFGGHLQLERIAQQVEDERKIQIREVHEVVFLLVVGFDEVGLELPAVVPRVIDMRGQLLRGVQHGVGPGVALDHALVKSKRRVQAQSGLLEALLALVVFVELETHVERLNVVVHCRA